MADKPTDTEKTNVHIHTHGSKEKKAVVLYTGTIQCLPLLSFVKQELKFKGTVIFRLHQNYLPIGGIVQLYQYRQALSLARKLTMVIKFLEFWYSLSPLL